MFFRRKPIYIEVIYENDDCSLYILPYKFRGEIISLLKKDETGKVGDICEEYGTKVDNENCFWIRFPFQP